MAIFSHQEFPSRGVPFPTRTGRRFSWTWSVAPEAGGDVDPVPPYLRVQSAGLEARVRTELAQDAFRLLVSGVTDYAIFMLDPHGMVVSWNEGAQRIKGYRADEIVGRHFSRFYEQADIDVGKR